MTKIDQIGTIPGARAQVYADVGDNISIPSSILSPVSIPFSYGTLDGIQRNSATEFEIIKKGIYMINAFVSIDAVKANSQRILYLLKNGATHKALSRLDLNVPIGDPNINAQTLPLTIIDRFNVGNTIELQVAQNSGLTLNVIIPETFTNLSMTLLRPGG